jgi:hypothetical protein
MLLHDEPCDGEFPQVLGARPHVNPQAIADVGQGQVGFLFQQGQHPDPPVIGKTLHDSLDLTCVHARSPFSVRSRRGPGDEDDIPSFCRMTEYQNARKFAKCDLSVS